MFKILQNKHVQNAIDWCFDQAIEILDDFERMRRGGFPGSPESIDEYTARKKRANDAKFAAFVQKERRKEIERLRDEGLDLKEIAFRLKGSKYDFDSYDSSGNKITQDSAPNRGLHAGQENHRGNESRWDYTAGTRV